MKYYLLVVVFICLATRCLQTMHDLSCVPDSSTGILPHLYDCTKFYKCHPDGMKITFDCPNSLHFNPLIEACDWPMNAHHCGKSSAKWSSTYRSNSRSENLQLDLQPEDNVQTFDVHVTTGNGGLTQYTIDIFP